MTISLLSKTREENRGVMMLLLSSVHVLPSPLVLVVVVWFACSATFHHRQRQISLKEALLMGPHHRLVVLLVRVREFGRSSPSSRRQLHESDLAQSTAMSEYFDLAAEGDLFKAPKPIFEEPVMDLDPMTAAISMISCGEDVVSSQGLKPPDSLQHEQLLSEIFYECKKDMLEKEAIESPLSEILEIKVPALNTDENQTQESKIFPGLPLPKSVSSGCLSSMDWMQGTSMKPSFIDFPGINFCADYGMRRAFSEGDIKALGSGNMYAIQSPLERPFPASNCTSEERREKLSRYRSKRTRRNFGRKIKYACRKALADSQPRIRGRFAKPEEFDARRQC